MLKTLMLFVCCGVVSAQEWPGKGRDWRGFQRFDFSVEGRKCFVVQPRHSAPGRPWVWRARFPSYHADADVILLKRGFHVAFVDTNGMLGSPRSMKLWRAFHAFVTQRGLARRVALHGVSRGGLFVYGFAARHPELVACIYGDTPVCDIKSWPLGQGKGVGHAATWKGLLREYGLSEDEALSYRGNPVDRLEEIAKARIPILHVVSLNDRVVPALENTQLLRDRYLQLGSSMEVIEVKEGTKQSKGHHFTHPDFLRVADFIERHASVVPDGAPTFVLRGSMRFSQSVFETTGKGRVAFLGGSITQNPGWRDSTKAYLERRFPKTEFEFVDAGVSSTGSVYGAFRVERDVFGHGKIDLLFEEAAVNDLHNGRSALEMTRGMEGIIGRARSLNPKIDIAVMHFVDPAHLRNYTRGVVPQVIERHEEVAARHRVTSIHLSREVFARIRSGQFTWKRDFRNVHPSPFGQRLYASTIRRMLFDAWPRGSSQSVARNTPREVIDRYSYDRGSLLPPTAAVHLSGFEVIQRCDPRAGGIGGGVRAGFVNVPMLVATQTGATCELKFKGRAIGVFVAAGPDAGMIDYRIDGGEWKRQDLLTRWSKGLHLPWSYMLASELDGKAHTLSIRVAQFRGPEARGSACRVISFLLNR